VDETVPVGRGLDRGREAFDRQAWSQAYEHLSAASEEESLEVSDHERLASAAYLAGRSVESMDVWARAHQECARIGEVARAARCAFWLAFALLNGGEVARGGGWVDRAQRLLDGRKLDCVEQGYLRYAAGLRAVLSGDVEPAYAGVREAMGIGERYRSTELTTLARIGEGRCLIYLGRVDEGVALLDEAMVAVEANDVSPVAAGDAFCTVIDGCHELFDIGRTREWTGALTRWCDAQPELVLYRGECLVHRAEVLQLRGAWSEASAELEQALARLAASVGARMVGAATYLWGDLHRLRGEFLDAERAYRSASDAGREPQPGLALLRLAQGRVDVADAMIRRAVREGEDPMTRAGLLGPFVEVVLASADVEAAGAAADELAALAGELRQPYLRALAAHAMGMVRAELDDPTGALVSLRRAWRGWRDLEAPYHAAKARVLIALACRALGDEDSAEMELDAARSVFRELGAAPDVASVDSLSNATSGALPGGLTPREAEVLALVAQGHTNRQIAGQLVISEKTVASHLSHMFTKLDVPSRAAATAFAYEHGLA
jgi:DNA-binding CsgD family transcriptional regulator